MRKTILFTMLIAASCVASTLLAGDQLLQPTLADPNEIDLSLPTLPAYSAAPIEPVQLGTPTVAPQDPLKSSILAPAVDDVAPLGTDATFSPGSTGLDSFTVGSGISDSSAAAQGAIVASLRLAPGNNGATIDNNRSKQIRFDSDVPQLRVSTEGPDTLVVGRAARYVITLTNLSSFEASDVAVKCSIPKWVDLESHQASSGDLGSRSPTLVWNVDNVSSNGNQKLALDLIPRAGRGFELNVDVAVQPTKSRKKITIKEPKLQLALQGPDNVVYGETGVWKLSIDNPGTGDANEVNVEIFSGSTKLCDAAVGSVVAGGNRELEMELSARATGVHPLRAVVTGSLGLRDNASTEFLVRRGLLTVGVTGSELEYAGSNTKYVVVVRNDGNAIAKNVLVNLTIPEGVTYLSGLEQFSRQPEGISWMVKEIPVGKELRFPLAMQIVTGGVHELGVTATTVDNLAASHSIVTQSEIAADLKLEVIDPSGPRPIGTILEYEIHITNHGTDVANQIAAIAVCSPEVEAVDVSSNAAIKQGQIFFKPVESLKPGMKVVHRVKVRATKPGSHAFRVIVKCYDPDLRLASEETTRFFDREETLEIISRRNGVPSVARQPAAGR